MHGTPIVGVGIRIVIESLRPACSSSNIALCAMFNAQVQCVQNVQTENEMYNTQSAMWSAKFDLQHEWLVGGLVLIEIHRHKHTTDPSTRLSFTSWFMRIKHCTPWFVQCDLHIAHRDLCKFNIAPEPAICKLASGNHSLAISGSFLLQLISKGTLVYLPFLDRSDIMKGESLSCGISQIAVAPSLLVMGGWKPWSRKELWHQRISGSLIWPF